MLSACSNLSCLWKICNFLPYLCHLPQSPDHLRVRFRIAFTSSLEMARFARLLSASIPPVVCELPCGRRVTLGILSSASATSLPCPPSISHPLFIQSVPAAVRVLFAASFLSSHSTFTCQCPHLSKDTVAQFRSSSESFDCTCSYWWILHKWLIRLLRLISLDMEDNLLQWWVRKHQSREVLFQTITLTKPLHFKKQTASPVFL